MLDHSHCNSARGGRREGGDEGNTCKDPPPAELAARAPAKPFSAMARLLSLLVLVMACAARAFVLPAQLPAAAAPVAASALRVAPGAIEMRRRTNLKKEKRARNRVNAFRFKKASASRAAHCS